MLTLSVMENDLRGHCLIERQLNDGLYIYLTPNLGHEVPVQI